MPFLQFTTLENTPPELLFLGSRAVQSYASDSFCIGLSYVHLLMGEEPYEEHLKDVRCPPLLRDRLSDIWLKSKKCRRGKGADDGDYAVIKEVIGSLDTSDASDNSVSILVDQSTRDLQSILQDTLYRYLVLFGLSHSAPSATQSVEEWISTEDAEEGFPYGGGNSVSRAILECVGKETGRRSKSAKEARRRYEADCSHWSLKRGSQPAIVR